MAPSPQAAPILAVGAVVLDGSQRVLLVERGRPPHAGRWSLPGGKVEAGEAPADAIVREVREETGIETRVLRHLGIVIVASEGRSFAIHEHLLEASSPAPEPRAADDAADARWFSPDELPALGLTAEVLAVIQKARAGRPRTGQP